MWNLDPRSSPQFRIQRDLIAGKLKNCPVKAHFVFFELCFPKDKIVKRLHPGTFLYHLLVQSYAIPWKQDESQFQFLRNYIQDLKTLCTVQPNMRDRYKQVRSDQIRSVITLHYNFDTLVLQISDGFSISLLECAVCRPYSSGLIFYPIPSNPITSYRMSSHVMQCHAMPSR